MKRNIVFLCIGIAFALIGAFAIDRVDAASEGGHAGMSMLHDMDSMLEPLKGLSGQAFDRGFYSMMIPHHQGAVDMSKKILETTKDSRVMEWANAIISGQNREIEHMQKAVAEAGGIDRKLYDMMTSDSSRMVEETTSDRKYVEMMIPHHESAVGMAEMAKGRTGNPELLNMAKHIIAEQKKEINAFRAWLNTKH